MEAALNMQLKRNAAASMDIARSGYAIASWALVILGIVHLAATAVYFDNLSSQALWFFSGGLFMISIAVLNLLNRSYGRSAQRLRVVCIGSNFVIIAFAVTSAIVSSATLVESTLVFVILVPMTALSLVSSALCEASQSGTA